MTRNVRTQAIRRTLAAGGFRSFRLHENFWSGPHQGDEVGRDAQHLTLNRIVPCPQTVGDILNNTVLSIEDGVGWEKSASGCTV